MSKNELPKAYDAQAVEDAIYDAWLESQYFTPEHLPNLEARTEPFTIVLPPPNVTGTLHMGHAMMLAIEDVMIRFARMQGKRALWIPGTDHAAVATESKVEKLLIDEGMEKPKETLGREVFLEHVRDFAQKSHDTIVNQTKKMGASLDWTREAFTLDAPRHKAVNTIFKQMYEDGLIYRGYRVVNWSVRGQSTCSDDELVHVERPAKLYTFKYSKDIPITIATTRPETKVGDTAIAVHPEGRWKAYIGQEFTVENFGQPGHTLTLKVIGDDGIDDDFGTGALGVTTAHSPIDFDMYMKQKALGNDIGLIQVIGEDGCMTANAGSAYEGLTVVEAREKMVAWLDEQGLLEQTEDIMQSAGTSDRFKDVVEPLPKTQWFIDVNKKFAFKGEELAGVKNGDLVSLKELMQKVVREQAIHILPDRFEKTYFHWIDNLRDWCISRQIWYGHQIPVWYKGDDIVVGEQPEGEGWEQDSDTLDTWFSSGIWTFSTLGWPDQTDDFQLYHPTQVLETGYDILFFWIARMILMTTYALGDVPFETVYLHGLVRDEEGRKMSKSLGNIIDPLDMIKEYGADATRLSLLIGSSPGNDMKLSEEKIAGFRNFTNKLWNISRFVFMSVDDVRAVDAVEPQTLADRWILGRLSATVAKATAHLEAHEFSLAGELLRDFTWNEFADWYVEIAKVQNDKYTHNILLYVLNRILRLWHPFMPFVTEELYKQFNAGMLIVEEWPKANGQLSSTDEEAFALMQEVVIAARNIRAKYNVPPKNLVKAVLVGGEAIAESKELIMRLGRMEDLQIVQEMEKPEHVATAIVGDMRLYVSLEGLIDTDAERARLTKAIEEVQGYIGGLEGRLANTAYVQNAPEAVVASTREELQKAQDRKQALEEELASLTS